jgi:hypothetical protein
MHGDRLALAIRKESLSNLLMPRSDTSEKAPGSLSGPIMVVRRVTIPFVELTERFALVALRN